MTDTKGRGKFTRRLAVIAFALLLAATVVVLVGMPSAVRTLDSWQSHYVFTREPWGQRAFSQFVVGSCDTFENGLRAKVTVQTTDSVFEDPLDVELLGFSVNSVYRAGFPFRYCKFSYTVDALSANPYHHIGYYDRDVSIGRTRFTLAVPHNVNVLPAAANIICVWMLLLAACFGSSHAFRVARARRAFAKGRCLCGYPLAGSICPECGRETSAPRQAAPPE